MPKKIANVLTAMAVKNAPPGRYGDGNGLYLRVKDQGTRSWVFRYMLRGKSRDVGLGSASGPSSISLAVARDKAVDLRRMVLAGIDPVDQKRHEAEKKARESTAARIAAVTLRDAATTHIEAHRHSWRNAKHAAQWLSTLERYVFPTIGSLPVGEITTAHVISVLEPIWQAKAETANRVRGRLEAILDSARVRGHREGENPARWRGHLSQTMAARSRTTRRHHAALPFAELPALMQALQARQAMAALALEFTILTAARTSETIEATWEEIDLKAGVWTVPASRMKAGKIHRVPLSERAIEILRQVRQADSRFIFPCGQGTLSNMAMAMLLRRMEVPVTVHGFRSTFRDWAAETTGYSHEVCEMALAHTIGNKAEAAYRRGDLFQKRRNLMEEWATFCCDSEAASDNHTPKAGGKHRP